VKDFIPPVRIGFDEESHRQSDVAWGHLVACAANARGALCANDSEELFLGSEATDDSTFCHPCLGGHIIKGHLVVAQLSEQPPR
jgi:hypothetical protein